LILQPSCRIKTKTTRRLRAINRAPLKVQELYRDGYLSQVDAARLGPEPPQKEKAEESDDKAKKKRRRIPTSLSCTGGQPWGVL
jgi:hypothetical protein